MSETKLHQILNGSDNETVTVKMLREALENRNCLFCGCSQCAKPEGKLAESFNQAGIDTDFTRDQQSREEPSDYHYHRTEDGFFVRCYHAASKSLLTNWKFWAVLLISFPIEHYIWTKVYPFTMFSGFLGLN